MAALRAIRTALLPAAGQPMPVVAGLRMISTVIVPTAQEATAAAEAAADATTEESTFIVHMGDVFDMLRPSEAGQLIAAKPVCYDLSAPEGCAALVFSNGLDPVILPMRNLDVFMETWGTPLPIAAGTKSTDGALLQLGIYPKLKFGWYTIFKVKGSEFSVDTMKSFNLHCQKSSGIGLLQYGENISTGAVFEAPITPDVFSALKIRISTHYAIEEELGRGFESIVWKAKSKDDDHYIALKKMKVQYILQESREAFVSKTIRSSLIRPPIFACNEEKNDGSIETCIGLQYQPMTLMGYVDSRPIFCLKTRLRMLLQAFHGVDFLHGNNYAHRDLNLRNFFVNGESVSLGDLGFVDRIVNQTFSSLDTRSGKSGSWCAPDMLVGNPTKKAEVYPMAFVMLFMLSKDLRGTVYQNFREFEKILIPRTTKERMKKWSKSQFAKAFQGSKELLFRMLSPSPKDRPTNEEIIAWIEGVLESLEDEE